MGGFQFGGFRMFGQAEVEERFKFLGDVRIRIAGVEALQHAELEGAFAVLVPEGLQPLVRVKAPTTAESAFG